MPKKQISPPYMLKITPWQTVFVVPLHQKNKTALRNAFIIFYLYKNNNGVSIGVSKSHCCFYALIYLIIYREDQMVFRENVLFILWMPRQNDAWVILKAIKTDGNNKTRQTKLNNYKR